MLNPAGEIVAVPAAVFAAIGPVAMVLVETDATVVHQRLAARAPEAPSADVIARHAERERERAAANAALLKVPLFTLAGDGSVEKEGQDVVDSLRRLAGGAG